MYSLCPHDFQVGEKVRFTKFHVTLIRKTNGPRPLPAWLDEVGTIAKVGADGRRVAILMPGMAAPMEVSPTILERA